MYCFLIMVSQAEGEHTGAREVLIQAPFLVPFKDRVRIFTVFKILRTSTTSLEYDF